jgi:hypothetical protein
MDIPWTRGAGKGICRTSGRSTFRVAVIVPAEDARARHEWATSALGTLHAETGTPAPSISSDAEREIAERGDESAELLSSRRRRNALAQIALRI